VARDIASLNVGDVVTFRAASGGIATRRVVAVGRATFQYENQAYFLDSDGNTHWEGNAELLDPNDVVPVKKKSVTQGGATALRHADGTRKTIREILFYSNDGDSSFDEEVKDVIENSKEAGQSVVNGWRRFWQWLPAQYPKATAFDIGNPLVVNMIGYKSPGINEVSRPRLFRGGYAVRVVDNGDGRLPRPFMGRYITRAGMTILVFALLLAFSVAINIAQVFS
jgi:hypothetical protein